MFQASASDWDAPRQLPLLWAGGDDSAAAKERRHQSRPVHRLAGHHDQGETHQPEALCSHWVFRINHHIIIWLIASKKMILRKFIFADWPLYSGHAPHSLHQRQPAVSAHLLLLVHWLAMKKTHYLLTIYFQSFFFGYIKVAFWIVSNDLLVIKSPLDVTSYENIKCHVFTYSWPPDKLPDIVTISSKLVWFKYTNTSN